jgi:hypothetical protein
MGERPTRSGDARSERERRLAEALRRNLKRRKLQQREREGTSGDPVEDPADAAPAEKSTGDFR